MRGGRDCRPSVLTENRGGEGLYQSLSFWKEAVSGHRGNVLNGVVVVLTVFGGTLKNLGQPRRAREVTWGPIFGPRPVAQ